MYEDELKHLSEKMDKSIQALRNEFTSIRTGQASPSLFGSCICRLLWIQDAGYTGGICYRTGSKNACRAALG